MIKPLLRTLPIMSGNVKIACLLTDFNKIDTFTFESNVRNARLLPLSSNVNQKMINISLLESSYEFDIKKFYSYYSDIFYDSKFTFNKNDYAKYDKVNINNSRNTDFEFGVKRLPYQQHGYQFGFYAPIYIDDAHDIPDYFLIRIKIKNNFITTERNIRVNIKENYIDDTNYLYKYINRYVSKIDDNFIYLLEKNKQATYYGIDLVYGGFVRKIDNDIKSIYEHQMSVNNFDYMITSGWKRNGMCIKQVLPLSFYFNLNDILTKNEIDQYTNSDIYIEGEYYRNNRPLSFYDFDIDYDEFYQKIIRFDMHDGIFRYVTTNKNILNVPNPGLNESECILYKYSNKINPMYTRWKMKYSNDVNPYITNLNFDFSYNQGSPSKYGSYPMQFTPMRGFIDVNNNFAPPLDTYVKSNMTDYSKNLTFVENYNAIMNKYATTWYNIVRTINGMNAVYMRYPAEVDDSLIYYYKDVKFKFQYKEYKRNEWTEVDKSRFDIEHLSKYDDLYYNIGDLENPNYINPVPDNFAGPIYMHVPNNYELKERLKICHGEPILVYYVKNIWDNCIWADVKDNRAYFGGVLYDFKSIAESIEDMPHIDKFGMFVKLKFDVFSKDEAENIKMPTYALFDKSNIATLPNCTVNDEIYQSLHTATPIDKLYKNEIKKKQNTNEISTNSLFILNKNGDGNFIDLTYYGILYHEINKYYKLEDIIVGKNYDNIEHISEFVIEGYEILPIFYNNSLYYENLLGKQVFELRNEDNLKAMLYLSAKNSSTKIEYTDDYIKSARENTEKYGNVYYLKGNFVSYKDIKILNDEEHMNINIDDLQEYNFTPQVIYNAENVAVNVFTKYDDTIDGNYGNIIPSSEIVTDKDVIYVDPYNVNNIVNYKNTTYSYNYSYYVNEGEESPYREYKHIELNDCNSYEFPALLLNKTHLHYYFTKISHDLNNNVTIRPEETLYIRKRIFYVDGNDECDLTFTDEYIPMTYFYSKWNPYIVNYYDEVMKDFVYNEDIKTWEFKKPVNENDHTIISENFERDKGEGRRIEEILNLPTDFNVENFTFDVVYRKRFIKVNEELFSIINLDNGKEQIYKDMFLYIVQKPYDYNSANKLLFEHKIDQYEQKGIFYNKISLCLTPLFNDYVLQKKEDTIVYEKYNQNSIIKAKYGYICVDEELSYTGVTYSTAYSNETPNYETPENEEEIIEEEQPVTYWGTYNYVKEKEVYGTYYRYNAGDVLLMMDISKFQNSGNYDYITAYSPYDPEKTRRYKYFSYSYVTSYFEETGYNLLAYDENRIAQTFDYINPSYSYLALASNTFADAYTYTYTYTNKSYTYIGHTASYTYYSYNRFRKLFTYTYTYYVGDLPRTGYAMYDLGENTGFWYNADTKEAYTYTQLSYTYHPSEIRNVDVITYRTVIYDDKGLFDKFKLNTYSFAYTYSYYNVENVVTTKHIVPKADEFIAYDVTTMEKQLVEHTGVGEYTYAFYTIDVTVNNTGASFNIMGDDYEAKKMFTSLNGIRLYDINDENYDFTHTFNLFVPFSKLNLLKSLNEIDTVVKPSIYEMPNELSSVYDYDMKAYTIAENRIKSNSIQCERYLSNIVPNFKQTTNIRNLYNLKYKNVDKLPKLSYVDSVLFKDESNIYNYKPIRVYDVNSNEYTNMIDLEHKYFNDNKFVNLKENIEIIVGDALTANEVNSYSQPWCVVEAFKNYVKGNNKNDYNDTDILFLYNRYDVKFDTTMNGINYNQTEKLYKLIYKFTLI